MHFGVHVSIAGGVENAPIYAHEIGCETFQMFTRSPQGGPTPALTKEAIKKFKDGCLKFGYQDYYVHAPYYINLASGNPRVYHGSISALEEELKRSSLLGVKYMMTHLGSAKDLGQTEAMKKVVAGIKEILKDYRGKTKFLMEMSAGAGMIIGDTLEEMAEIIKKVGREDLGVCFDSCHAFASGYDLRDQKAVKKFFDDFDKIIGLDRLKVVHANDSMFELGSRKDRHQHIGHGKIGLDGFRAMIHEPRLKKLDMILETPWVTHKEEIDNLKTLKDLRENRI